jgi:hypothetical protein
MLIQYADGEGYKKKKKTATRADIVIRKKKKEKSFKEKRNILF